MDIKENNEYKYDFKDKDVSIFKTKKGLNEEIIREISKHKNEPEWMLEYRLKAYNEFVKRPLPSFGPDLSEIDFNDFTYFSSASAPATLAHSSTNCSLLTFSLSKKRKFTA